MEEYNYDMSTRKQTKEEIQKRLDDMGMEIEIIGDYKNTRTKCLCRCRNDGHEWNVKLTNTLYQGKGCPKCSRNAKITNQTIDKRLIGKNIVRLEDVSKSSTNIRWQCEIDKYIWKSCPNNIVNNNRGCPMCSKKARITNEIIDSKLIGRNIQRLSNIKSMSDIMKWKCTVDGNIWETCAANVIHRMSGCPKCKRSKREIYIANWLTKNGVNYNEQYKHPNCKNRHMLPFDFYLPLYHTLIEYQGDIHYKVVEHMGGKNGLKQRQKHDLIKMVWAINNGYRYLHLDYTMDDKTINFLLSEAISLPIVA